MMYVIVPTAELTEQMVADCYQTSPQSVRRSLDGSEAILGYAGDKPSSLSAYTELTKAQLDAEIASGGWNPDLGL
jgi:hypothetical protein